MTNRGWLLATSAALVVAVVAAAVGLLLWTPSAGQAQAGLSPAEILSVCSADPGACDPVVDQADRVRTKWLPACARENLGQCAGGSSQRPEPRLRLSPPRDPAGKELWERLERLHDPVDCSPGDEQRTLVLRLGGQHNACAYQGLWGKVQRLAAALGWALAHNHKVVFQQTDNWIGVGPGWCPERSWLCFFQELAPSCRHNDSAAALSAWHASLPRAAAPVTFWEPYACLPAIPRLHPKNPTTSLEQIKSATALPTLGWSACMHDNLDRCKVTGSELPAGISTDHQSNRFFGDDVYVPADLRARPAQDRGMLRLATWWEAILSRFLLRPRPFVLDYIERSKEAVAWPSEGTSVVGVHVRRGDKYDNNLDVSVFEEYYLPKIQQLVQKHGLKHVFVATDSPLIIQALQAGSIQAAKAMDVQWIVFGKDQSQLPSFARFRDIDGPYSKAHWYHGLKGNDKRTASEFSANTLTSIRDVWLLGQCHHFVGTHVSAVSRFAAMLLVGNRLAATQGPLAREAEVIWPEFPGINQYR